MRATCCWTGHAPPDGVAVGTGSPVDEDPKTQGIHMAE